MVDSVEVKRSKTILLLLLGLYSPRALFAQKQTGGAEIIAYPIEKTRSGELRKASKVDAKQVCRKYEGRYIGYYGKLYKVEGCKRRKVASQKLRLKIMKSNSANIQSVTGEVIRALELGGDMTGHLNSKRSCRQLDEQYMTVDYIEIYFAQNCRLYRIPDWQTFKTRRKKYRQNTNPILEVSLAELMQFGTPLTMSSELDRRQHNLGIIEEQVEVISIGQACKGLNNKYASFHGLLYKVENCRKRQIDPAAESRRLRGKLNPVELSSEQWISIPDKKQ